MPPNLDANFQNFQALEILAGEKLSYNDGPVYFLLAGTHCVNTAAQTTPYVKILPCPRDAGISVPGSCFIHRILSPLYCCRSHSIKGIPGV